MSAHAVAAFESSLLALVAGGATPPELRAAVSGAARGLPPHDLAELERRLALAMNLHDEIEDLRRSTREMQSLILTVADVTTLRDLEGALHAICGHARALLSADVAWLSVVDPSRRYKRVFDTDGARTPEFNSMSFEYWHGMSGRVVSEKQSRSTQDYLSDTTFEHTEQFDRAFAAEGVRAVACVPLRRGEDVVGVLLVGSRTCRVFTPRDITQLETLGAHAAIVLENGRLFDETQKALGNLREAERRTRLHAAELERSFRLDEQLMSLVIEGASLESVCATVAQVLGGSLAVLDPQGRVVLITGEPHDELDRLLMGGGLAAATAYCRPLKEALHAARESREAVLVEGDGRRLPRRVASVYAGSEPLGELVFAGHDASDTTHLLTRVTTVLALVVAHSRDLEVAESRSRDGLLIDLLRAVPQELPSIVRRAARLGVDLERSMCVFVAAMTADAPPRTVSMLARLASAEGGIAGEVAGEIVILLPGTDVAGLHARVRDAVPAVALTSGAAGSANGAAEVVVKYQEARRVMHLLQGLGRDGANATMRDLGFFGVVFPPTGNAQVERFVQDTLGPIQRYDAERGTDLLNTVEVYFDNGGHLAGTATALHVHINTLYQRLDRIRVLLGDDWREADRRLQVHLAVRLRRIALSIDAAPAEPRRPNQAESGR